jgi:hypothetical protein
MVARCCIFVGQNLVFLLTANKDQIKEFEISGECIQECLKNIDTGKIQFNPFAYFRIQYMMATVAVAKRKRQRDMGEKEEDSLQEYGIPPPEYMIKRFRELREQLTKT